MDIQTLQNSAIKVAASAYVPYSHFQVGAALLCPDGQIITGVNVENTSYGLSVCAERNAICAAVTQGYTYFTAIAVYSPQANSFLTPCGACRQTLAEFMGKDALLYMSGKDQVFVCKTLADLLPFGFSLDEVKN